MFKNTHTDLHSENIIYKVLKSNFIPIYNYILQTHVLPRLSFAKWNLMVGNMFSLVVGVVKLTNNNWGGIS